MSHDELDGYYVVGSINDAAKELYDELLTSGSSLLLSDVVKVFINTTKKYVGWSGRLLNKPLPGSDLSQKPLLMITENTVIDVTDWLIIEPVIRAHCDLVQARRMEGAQGLGVNPTGMSSSEARGYYDEALLKMQKEAFQGEPFTIKTPQNNSGLISFFANNLME